MDSTNKRHRSVSPFELGSPPAKHSKGPVPSPSKTLDSIPTAESDSVRSTAEEPESPASSPSPSSHLSDPSSVTVCSMRSSNNTIIEDIDLREFWKPWTSCYSYEEIELELQSRRESWKADLPHETWTYLTDTSNDIRGPGMIERLGKPIHDAEAIPSDAYNTELVWREREILKAHREASFKGYYSEEWYHEW